MDLGRVALVCLFVAGTLVSVRASAYHGVGVPGLRDGAPLSVGTTFYYNRLGDVLTNRHVVERCADRDQIWLRDAAGAWHKARVIAISREFDLAALSTGKPTEYFASIRTTAANRPLVPRGVEHVFSAGFSGLRQIWATVQLRLARIQRWLDPQRPPFIQRMRMDAAHGASGSPVLDYAALLVGIVIGISKGSAPISGMSSDPRYGDEWVYMYNTYAIRQFIMAAGLYVAPWDAGQRRPPQAIADHARHIVLLLVCESR